MSALTQRRSGRLALLGMGLVLIAALAFAGPPSNAEVIVTTDAGVILLSTGPEASDNWVQYYEDTSSFDIDNPTERQTFTVNRCGVTTDDSILAFSQSGGKRGIGLVSNGFGTRDKNNCAQDGGQIEVGQSLTLGLGTIFSGSAVAIDLAEVDIEGKQNADLRYQLGDSSAVTTDLRSAPDNGPDSGANDNAVIAIEPAAGDGPFTSITFSPTGNSKALISVEGGGDGALPGEPDSVRTALGVNQTVFRLVTSETFNGEILCGQEEGPDSIATDGPATDGLLTRLADLKDTDPCDADEDLIPYTFEIQEDNVFFNFLDSGEGAAFLVRIDWDPDDATVDPLAPPIRRVNYFDDLDANYVAGVACTQVDEGTNIDPLPDSDDEFSHPVSDGSIPSGDGTFFANGETVPVCLAGQQILLEGDKWVQIQYWSVIGDPRWKF